MKTHRHARYPLTPSSSPMAVARRPPNAPATAVELKKKVLRFCTSTRLYHMEIMLYSYQQVEETRFTLRNLLKAPRKNS